MGIAARLTSIRTLAMVPAPPALTQADSSPISTAAQTAGAAAARASPPPSPAHGVAARPRGRKRRSRRLLVTTSSELADMAIPANSGLT